MALAEAGVVVKAETGAMDKTAAEALVAGSTSVTTGKLFKLTDR